MVSVTMGSKDDQVQGAQEVMAQYLKRKQEEQQENSLLRKTIHGVHARQVRQKDCQLSSVTKDGCNQRQKAW